MCAEFGLVNFETACVFHLNSGRRSVKGITEANKESQEKHNGHREDAHTFLVR